MNSATKSSLAAYASNKLWMRYAIGLGAIVALIVGHHVVSIAALSNGAQDEELINVSGRQRMLSQRVLFLSDQYIETGAPDFANELEAAVDLFERSHTELVEAARSDPALEDVYGVGIERGLDERVATYVRHARVILNEDDPALVRKSFVALVALGRNTLLRDLDAAVSAFETRANERSDFMNRIQVVMLLMALATILLVLVFVFRPMNAWLYEAVSKLDSEANRDALTGLMNRKRWLEVLAADRDSLAEDKCLLVVASDLDGFKSVNDVLGHPAGDLVLEYVADLMAKVSDEHRLSHPAIARIGGDEFFCSFVVSPEDLDGSARNFANSIIQHLREPIELKLGSTSRNCIVGASFGYAGTSARSADIDLLVSDADIALYHSKQGGKGRCSKFSSEMRELAEYRLSIETDIRRGVLDGEFIPYFQPQYSAKSDEITGVEVLARWRHPQRGLLAAGEFMPDAEDLGVSDLIDGAISLSALEYFGAHLTNRNERLKMSINASEVMLTNDGFSSQLLSACEMFGVPTTSIVIEVLETVMLGSESAAIDRSLRALREAGFALVVDDFGTGYSSIETVADLDICGLKIDRSLVMRSAEERFEKILQATVAMAKGLDVEVCAEGVETEQALRLIKRTGCDTVQGYYLSKPISGPDLLDLLQPKTSNDVVTQFRSIG